MAVVVFGVGALGSRGCVFVLAFAVGCVPSSAYRLRSGAWPLGMLELVWAGVAVGRHREVAPTRSACPAPDHG